LNYNENLVIILYCSGGGIVKLYDYIVIGSGFGGSVSAMRLAEKGYSVLVLEEGKWYEDDDYPKTNNNPFKYFWFPKILCKGYQRINFFKHLAVLGACGVGGGSINYANTLLKPPKKVFNSADFPKGIDWEKELDRFYEAGSFMLGKVTNPNKTQIDDWLIATAKEINVDKTYYPVDVGVYFGESEVTVPDPYFSGEGPSRTGCDQCAGCMTGCKVGAKNMLLKNYLFFALKFGAEIIPLRKVVDIIKSDGEYEVITVKSTSLFNNNKKKFRAKNIVLSAGVIGTIKLLFTLKDKKRLPLSTKIGKNVRSNSESLIGVRKTGKDINLAEGIAITSGLYIDEITHIEGVRYPKGSNSMSIISAILTDKHKGIYRPLTMLRNILRHPYKNLRVLNPIGWAKESVILLVMQTDDNRIQLLQKKGLFGQIKIKSGLEDNKQKAPVYIPQANDFAKIMGDKFNAIPLSCVYEVFFDTPLTAHILGGSVIANDIDDGVIDTDHRLFNNDSFYIIDASAIPSNLGVNPALTITAMAERAMDKIPFNDGIQKNRIGLENNGKSI
jgi:cholesterol oxidase